MSAKIENEGRRNGFPWWPAAGLAGLAILVAPAIAMQFTREVMWDVSDFLVMAALLAGLGAALALMARRVHNPLPRTMVGAIVILVFIAIWAELATGEVRRFLGEF